MFKLSFCLLVYSLLINRSIASLSNNLYKRQAIASRQCGDQNNTVSICSPDSSSIWYNNTYEQVTWKYNNPTFDQYNKLDLYLLYQNSSSYKNVKVWAGLDKSKGIIVPLIDDSWYPAPIANNSPNVTWNMLFFIVGADYDYQSDLDALSSAHNFFPAPQPFTLIQSSKNTTLTGTPTVPAAASPTNVAPTPNSSNIPSSDNSSKKLPGWAIAVIVIASLLFILATGALIWAYRRYKNKKQMNGGAPNNHHHGDDEKIPVLAPNKNESNVNVAPSPTTAIPNVENNRSGNDISSIHSSTQQLWSPRSLSPKHDEISFITTSEKPIQQPQQQHLGLHSEANHSSSILSSTDALMIADTFRQFMRKPEWNEELELNEQSKNRITSKKESEN